MIPFPFVTLPLTAYISASIPPWHALRLFTSFEKNRKTRYPRWANAVIFSTLMIASQCGISSGSPTEIWSWALTSFGLFMAIFGILSISRWISVANGTTLFKVYLAIVSMIMCGVHGCFFWSGVQVLSKAAVIVLVLMPVIYFPKLLCRVLHARHTLRMENSISARVMMNQH